MKNWILPDVETLWRYSSCIQGKYHWQVTDQGVLVAAEIRPNELARWLEVAREVS